MTGDKTKKAGPQILTLNTERAFGCRTLATVLHSGQGVPHRVAQVPATGVIQHNWKISEDEDE